MNEYNLVCYTILLSCKTAWTDTKLYSINIIIYSIDFYDEIYNIYNLNCQNRTKMLKLYHNLYFDCREVKSIIKLCAFYSRVLQSLNSFIPSRALCTCWPRAASSIRGYQGLLNPSQSSVGLKYFSPYFIPSPAWEFHLR